MNNFRKIVAGVAVTIAISTSITTPASALRSSGDFLTSPKIVTRGATRAPLGLQLFCLKEPAHCRGGGASSVSMTTDLIKVLNSVNRKVNRSIRPRHDKGDVWSVNVASGDCEDYVLTKRAQLIKLGVSAGALRIATAFTKAGEGHAVLVVRTNRGDWVLDNRRQDIREWHKTGLTWIAMSGSNPRKWNAV